MSQPMVDIGMMRDGAVLWTNIVALIAGFAMYGTFLLVPSFVQMGADLPESISSQIHYGLAASVIVAGLYLLPASAAMLFIGPIGGLMEARIGAKVLTGFGSAVLGLGGLTLAAFHSNGLQVVVTMIVIGVGIGFVYAMLAKLIVDSVSREVTGVAMDMNTVMRTIGGVIGAQVGAALLSAITIAGFNAALCTLPIPSRRRQAAAARARDEAGPLEMATAGD